MGLNNTHRSDTLRTNYQSIDYLKVVLAYLVIFRHCGQWFIPSSGLSYKIGVNTLSPIAVPTFFIISGFFFFGQEATRNRLFHQLKRIGLLYLVWTAVYFPLKIGSYIMRGFSFPKDLIKYVLCFFFSGSHFHLWFLPSLMFALVFAYFLQKHFTTKTSFTIAVLLYLIGLFGDTYSFLLPEKHYVLDLYNSIFFTTRNGLFFGVIYILIGKYIGESRNTHKLNSKVVAIHGVISFFVFWIEYYFLNIRFNVPIVNISIFSLLAAPLLFIAFLKWNNFLPIFPTKSQKMCRKFSTALFVVHPIAIHFCDLIESHFMLEVSPIINICFVFFLSSIASWVLAQLSMHCKLFKYFT